MKVDQKQGGYSLLLTLVLLILFAALGFSLMTLTSSGIVKNSKRQEITQSTTLSEMGIDRITKQITSELTKTVENAGGLKRDDFKTELEKGLNKYKCTSSGPSTLNKSTDTGTYDVCIEKYIDTIDQNNEANPLRKKVYFRSIGDAGDSDRQLNSTFEIGAEPFPETMKYAIGTNITSKNPKDGEGNLLLHGSSDISGDLKVDGNLIAYDHGTAGWKWIPSLLPQSFPSPNSTSSKLVLGGNMYLVNAAPSSSGSQSSYDNYIKTNKFTDKKFVPKTDTKSLFYDGKAPKRVKRDPVLSPITIKEHRSDFFFDHNTTGVVKVSFPHNKNGPKDAFSGYTNTESMVTPVKTEEKKCGGTNKNPIYCTEYKAFGPFTLEKTNKFKKLASSGKVTVRAGDHTFTEGLYVKNELMIGNNVNTDTPSKRDTIKLDGTMYVDGDVNIIGANLESNALMYVDGDVTIRFSSIKGKQLANKKTGTLIIFATGNIYMANNSVDLDTPSTINGYFYSQNNFELYGVGSNIKIEGGISAKRVVLNAVRGKASGEKYESVNNQKGKHSRLQVIYDAEIIENFLKLSKPEPIISKVDIPLEIDRCTNGETCK